MRGGLILCVPVLCLFVTSVASSATKKKPLAAEDLIESPAFVQPEIARLVAPKAALSTRDISVLLVTIVPENSGACYEPSADLSHIDRFTHVISARARIFVDATCAKRRSRFDFQTLDLGRLAPGTHTVRVEDTTTQLAPVTIVVTNGDIAAVDSQQPH